MTGLPRPDVDEDCPMRLPPIAHPPAARRYAGLLTLIALVATLAAVVVPPAPAARARSVPPAPPTAPPLATAAPAVRASAVAGGAVFEAVTPTRLADTRQGDCGCTRMDPNTIRVQVVGRAGVPADTSAVALSLTVTGTTGPGYATAWPAGSPMPGTSNINWGAGQTRANGAILAVGGGGAVDVYVSSAAQVIVDVTGAFTATDGAAAAGRFNTLTPDRLLDTRAGGRVGNGGVVTVPLPAGVPADATALAVTITSTDSAGWGYVVAYPSGAARPASSVVNTDLPGQTRAATAIVPVSAAGIDLYVDGGTHLLVDAYGWFGGPSSAAGTDGLFVPNAPLRVWDTRGGIPVWRGGTVEPYPSTQFPGSPQLWGQLYDASALVFNLTVADAPGAGWMTAYPARTPRPDTSTINWAGGDTVANLAITPWSASDLGGVAFYADQEADILVDVTGFFTGTPVDAPLPPAPNQSPGYTGEPASELVRDSVPPEVFGVLGGVDMQTLPALPQGAAGLASTPPERIRFAYLIYEGHRRNVARSTAAHEVGHILTFRWIQAGNPESRVDGLFGYQDYGSGHECIAEAIGRVLFARLGRFNYSPGYGGLFDACAVSGEAQALANEIVDAQS